MDVCLDNVALEPECANEQADERQPPARKVCRHTRPPGSSLGHCKVQLAKHRRTLHANVPQVIPFELAALSQFEI